jgi:hypothetical protein
MEGHGKVVIKHHQSMFLFLCIHLCCFSTRDGTQGTTHARQGSAIEIHHHPHVF